MATPTHPIHTGDEYRPLFLYQETTVQILAGALNPLDYRKWRNQSVSWRLLKVFKVHGGPKSQASGFVTKVYLATQPPA